MYINRLKKIPGRLAPYLRVRHARGHGIHSPFVYGLVRNALLYRRKNGQAEGELYRFLRQCGVNCLRARQIQNLHNYCDYRDAGVFSGQDHREANWFRRAGGIGTLEICTGGYPVAGIAERAAALRGKTGAVIVTAPRRDGERWEICRQIAAEDDCISIDNREFMVFIYGTGHTPHHYKL